MEWKNAIIRARRGFRDERRLYLVSMSSLAIAFVCLGGALLGVANLGALAERWTGSGRMTVYLGDDARPEDVNQLRMVLESLDEVRGVEHVSSAAARAELVRELESADALRGIPNDLMPASLEVALAPGLSKQRVSAMATRVGQFRGVESVDTYGSFFAGLERLLRAGRGAALAVAILVALCVLMVVGNTIRLAVARRQREIEVLKLCGATDAFVRRPFVVEGTLQAFASSFFALLVLAIGFALLRHEVDTTLSALLGTRVVFLSPLLLVTMLVGGGVVGAVGSFLSVRRYLSV